MTDRWAVERAVTGSNIDSRGRLIVLALLTKVDNATARTTPQHTPAFSTLCAMTGLSKAVVSEWLQALEDGGWVTRINPAAGGKGNRTIYQLALGADKIERRSRNLRKPRPAKKIVASDAPNEAQTVRPANGNDDPNGSPSEPFEEVQTVRPADGLNSKQFAQRTPNSSPGEPFEGSNSSPGERATTLKTTKNHQAERSADEPTTNPPPPSKPNWVDTNRQPPITGGRVPRQPVLFPKRPTVDIDKLLDAHKVIIRWLHANGYPNATAADAQAVHRAVIASMNGKALTQRYLIGIASGTGFAKFYQPILASRADEIDTAIRKLTASEPDCHHGTPAGAASHPTTGEMLCPRCRRNEPPTIAKLGETTHPDVKAALDVYRAASGARFNVTRYLTLTHEANALHNRGVDFADLVAIARHAAGRNCGFLEAAISLKGQLV